MSRISIITIGTQESAVLNSLLSIEGIDASIICSNILDFELPPLVENAAPIWHRHELRNALMLIGANKFKITDSLKDLLKENDRLKLSDEYLRVTSHISQIEQNSKDLFVAYDLLLKETKRTNLELIPLADKTPNLLLFKGKKYSPLRFYYLQGKLLSETPPPNEYNHKRKSGDRKLVLEGLEVLKDLKLSEQAHKTLSNSDLIVILPTDIVSIAALVEADVLEKQLKNLSNPLILVWPFTSKSEMSDIEIKMTEMLNLGPTIQEFGEDLSFLTDYVILPKSEKGKMEILREAGCHVLISEFDSENGLSSNLIKTILGVADLKTSIINEVAETKETELEIDELDRSNAAEIIEGEEETDDDNSRGKQISQLSESPEEAGMKSKSLEVQQVNETENEEELAEIIDEIKTQEDHMEGETPENDDNKFLKTSPENGKSEEMQELEINFKVLEDEDWIDTVNRAIKQCFDNDHNHALKWLITQSKSDNDREIRIADQVITNWIQSKSVSERRKGGEIISSIAEERREIYLQILKRHMLQAVTERQEDKRRVLIPLFNLLFDIDITLSEALIRGITSDLANLDDHSEISVIELAKITILQVVIHNRRLSRVSIKELLHILDSKPNVGPEIWNILISFDAGSVALELVTNFAVSKAEEIIRRSNLLRFTGSYYSTISKVIQSWKDGDKHNISSAVGFIIPEDTNRKLERLELARKLNKLKMVQLTALADSLGKDVETVERLVTELIVNDELQAEMKLIDEKMYLVSTVDEENGN